MNTPKTKAVVFLFLCSILSRVTFLSAQINDIRISLLYDNTTIRSDLTPDWGFSSFVQCDENAILFDTGAKPNILRNNMKALGLDQSHIEAIVLSHEHADHVLGVSAFIGKSIPIIFLPSLARIYEQTTASITNAAAETFAVSDLHEIAPCIWISKPMGGICFEQALLIDTNVGLVVIVGCAHPGILAILNDISRSTGRPLYALVGGLHLVDSSTANIDQVVYGLKALGLKKVCPCHCTGEKAIERFKTVLPDSFISGGVGAVIHFRIAPTE